MTKEELELFHDSLRRCTASPNFLERFYELFLATSPEVAEKFNGTDWLRQKRMLVASFYLMMMAEETGTEGDPHLERIARLHGRRRLGVPPEMYSTWLDCLVQSAREHDRLFTPETERVWRAMMQKGISFMQGQYEQDASGPPSPK
jgi:hemoglobin-like flavoprotein